MTQEMLGGGAARASVTRLLARLAEGDRKAFDELVPLVYRELHGLARAQRRRWQGSETLDTTSLLHETYLKLADRENQSWNDRSHFLSVASRAMRQVLIDYAKRQAGSSGVPGIATSPSRRCGTGSGPVPVSPKTGWMRW
jgi:RNA polymerase sigma factor (TIGR02999 family)